MKEKYSAVLLSLIAGGLGLHKFYLGKTTAGILYAVFFWTFVPAVMAIIDAICYLFMTKEEFDERYNAEYIVKDSRSGNNNNGIALETAHADLLRAKALYESGALTEDEFLNIKQKILGEMR